MDPTAQSADGRRVTAAILVCVNLGVAVAALTQRYGYADLLLLYWAETVVIGLFAIPKLLIVAIFGDRIDDLEGARRAGKRAAAVAVMLVFGAAAFALLVMLLQLAIVVLPSSLARADRLAGLVVPRGPRTGNVRLEAAVIALALSHGASFVVNFIGGREFRGGSLLTLVLQPFRRTVAIAAVIALGLAVAFTLPGLSRSTWFALATVALKIWADLHAHLAERRHFQSAGMRTFP